MSSVILGKRVVTTFYSKPNFVGVICGEGQSTIFNGEVTTSYPVKDEKTGNTYLVEDHLFISLTNDKPVDPLMLLPSEKRAKINQKMKQLEKRQQWKNRSATVKYFNDKGETTVQIFNGTGIEVDVFINEYKDSLNLIGFNVTGYSVEG